MWIFLLVIGYLFFILLNVIAYAKYYFTAKLTIGGFAQVLYTLQNSMSGSESTVSETILDFFKQQGIWLFLGTLIFIGLIVLYVFYKQGKIKSSLDPKKLKLTIHSGIIVLVCLLLCSDLVQGASLYHMLGIQDYQDSLNKESDLYDKYYVDANTVELEFPEKKKNLIYIICESMEASYTDEEHGGGYKESRIPELTSLAKEYTDFSSSDDPNLNGGLTPGNTVWTIAGIAAQSMGLPLNIGNSEFNRNFENESQFLPTVQSLGDILEEAGYSNYFMCGSDAAFAGRKNYYEQHGDYEIYDLIKAREEGFIPEDYYVWWGFEDNKLFSYAKEKLPEIAKEDEPFNFTMLTVDTHFSGGYKCEDCPDEFDEQYDNVIKCSDKKVAEFVQWIQEQDFYEDTTIVIAGDHLSMDGLVAESVPEDYMRKIYFTVINGPEYTLNRTRQYASLDIFPTILEALGVKIEGDRLGLGTSLYSNTSTLIEILGFDELNRQMGYKSSYYDEVILNGDESKLPTKKDPEAEKNEESDQNPTEITAPSAQDYQANQENFSNPDYYWVPETIIVQQPTTNPSDFESNESSSTIITTPSTPENNEESSSSTTPPDQGSTTTPTTPDEGTSGDSSTLTPTVPDSGTTTTPTTPDEGTSGDSTIPVDPTPAVPETSTSAQVSSSTANTEAPASVSVESTGIEEKK